MMAADGEIKGRLEAFDGSDPAAYRNWKRRAQLMLAALPSTVSKEKYGARLMEVIRGEAEMLLETLEVSEIIKENGEKKIFTILDEKYLPQPRDLLQTALKGFFYDLSIKPGESFQQFLARYDAAIRRLREQKVELPKEVRGFMLIKKLRLESQQESMLLTYTTGNLEVEQVTKAVRSVFPEGRGGTKSQKDIFQAEDDRSELSGQQPEAYILDGENEAQEAMEVIADQHQSKDAEDDEEAVECFESYAEVRKKILEKKKLRGFSTPSYSGRNGPGTWKLTGTVNGKLEMLKSRTRCHICKQMGHWKRECPQKRGTSSSGASADKNKKEAMVAEVLVVDEDQKGKGVWQLFEQVPKNVTWQETQSDDVGNIGFADAHATGNRQRHDLVKPGDSGMNDENYENMVVQQGSPAPKVFPSRHFAMVEQDEVFELHFPEQEVLSADRGVVDSVKKEASDGNCAVIDSACRRTLIGEYTLQHLEQHLLKHNLKTVRRVEQCEFRFGNSGILVSKEAVLIPACVGDRKFLIKAAILPEGGSWTPLLLSKELMKQLGTILDTVEETAEFRRLGKTVTLRTSERGHYVVPLFCFGDVSDCLAVEGNSHRKNHERSFAISELEKSERLGVSENIEFRDPAEPCNADVHWQSDGHGGDHDRADDESTWRKSSEDGGWNAVSPGPGSSGRQCSGWNEESHLQSGGAERGKVCQDEESPDHGSHVRQRQGLHELGQEPHQGDQCSGNAKVPSVHLSSRSRKASKDQEGDEEEVQHAKHVIHGDAREPDAVDGPQQGGSKGQSGFERYEGKEGSRGFRSDANGLAVSGPGERVRDDQSHRCRVRDIDSPEVGLHVPDASPFEERGDRKDRGVCQGADHQSEVGQVHCEHLPCLEKGEVKEQENHNHASATGAEEHLNISSVEEQNDKKVNDRQTVLLESKGEEKEERSLTRVMNRKQRKALERNVHDINIVGCFENGCKCSKNQHEVFEASGNSSDDNGVDIMMVHIADTSGDRTQKDETTDFGEIYSMPRIAPMAQKKGLKVLGSFDIGNGWDFRLKEHRQKCRQQVHEKKPKVLVVCPPCGPFSPLQRLSKNKGDPLEKERKRIEGEVLLAFAMEICEIQREAGRVFVFEHPKGSDSWNCDCVKKVQNNSDVFEILLDQCCFGLRDPGNGKFYKKSTRLLTNAVDHCHLQKSCDGNHEHQRIEGQVKAGGRWVNRSRCAQIYPKALVEGLVRLAKNAVERQVLDVFTSEMLSGKNPHLESAVRRCHVNLGHPSKERFIHMLKSANASDVAIDLAKRLECSTCSAKRLQESHPVSKHRRAEAFNEQLCMDTFDLPIYQQKVLKMLNIVDEGTNLQLCIPLWKGARASEVRRAYRKYWKRWAGVPKRILTDGGAEFDEAAQEGFDQDGSYVEKTAAFAPWQNGIAERNGGVWKSVFAKAFEEGQPRNKDEINELIDQVNVARNSMGRRHGFTPYQHVFGGDFRLPGLLTEGEQMGHLQSGSGVTHAADSFWTRQRMRMAARKAMVEADEKDKVTRAVEHRSRPSKEFHVGQLVYYWRRFPKDNKKGAWRGPGRVIGYFDASKIWVCHGNKVLRCAPEQVRALTTDQEAAVKFVPIELQSQAGRFAKRGAQTFLDVTGQGSPPPEGIEDDTADSRKKRRRIRTRDDQEEEVEIDVDDENAFQEDEQHLMEEGAIDEETTTDQGMDRIASEAITLDHENTTGPTSLYDIAGNAYGPIRRRDEQQREDPLTTALRRSTELLDLGHVRRSANDETPDTYEVTIFDSDDKGACRHFDAFIVAVADRKNAELKNCDLTEDEKKSLDVGKQKELNKLLNTRSIKIHSGEDARKIYEQIDPKRILDSRFVKTRRIDPDDSSKEEIKCRWVVKGFQDPDLDDLERQSPTLSADGLAVALQTIASNNWKMTVADVEGAFLQGEEYNRKGGSIYTTIPREGFPGIPEGSVFELTKCVYGLMDAPLRWWRSITGTLKNLGVKQSELDPCLFYWFHEQKCQGVLAIHVDDILFGGTKTFEDMVLKGLKNRYPFKHWTQDKADFLGRRLFQQNDYSITIDQEKYSQSVRVAQISRDRRKEKDEPLTTKELQQYRAILGAANWIVGSTRPDIAAHTALLQQRVSKATVGDLVEANRLVAKIKDFAHTKIWIQSIPWEKAVLTVTSDASWGNAEGLGSQAGYMVLLSAGNIQNKEWAKVSPLRWKSYKMDRKTQSTLGAELMSVSRAIAEGDWIRSLIAEARFEKYDLVNDSHWREQMKMIICVDNKPIYDHVHGEGIVVRDKRLAIDMLLVRKEIRKENTCLHWIDTRQMLSDSLTKLDVNCDFLRFVLRSGKFIIVEEKDSLKWRLEERNTRKRVKEIK